MGVRFLVCWFCLVTLSLAAERPNIILMLADDQGWNGLSVAMHPELAGSKSELYHTPQLERLAADGMRFSAAYAPAPVCSPTRISLQTGKSPAQLHWTKAAPPTAGQPLIEPQLVKQISSDEVTVAELLKSAGYATAHYGKWHLGGGGPGQHGYDEHDGETGNETAYRFADPNPVDIFGMADRAAAFMEKNAKAGRPFFIQLSWHALHAPGNALAATQAKYRRIGNGRNDKLSATAAITEDLDTGVGRVLASVDRLGLADSTYIIYTSDNGSGGGRRNGGLNGGKGGVWEGGIRVPLIVRGPGIQPNTCCHVRVVGYDLLPTFCQWAGVARTNIPPSIEGGSLVELLAHGGQGQVRRPRDELVFHFPHYQGDAPHSAILVGDVKLIHFYEQGGRDLLFDLSTDLGERNDLSAERPAEAARLRARLTDHLAAINAQLPVVNPAYDPRQPIEPRQKVRGQRRGRGQRGEQTQGDLP
ncbi:MAG: sulfatase-like hydrolase/transferase [Pirellulales bacterium]